MHTAIILAGGLGTRLRSVVNDRPKVLATVNGRPFLAYLLQRCVKLGIQRVVLATGYMTEAIEVAFGDRFETLELVYSVETEPRGTGGALRLAATHVQTPIVLAMNGDSYSTADLAAFVDWYQQGAALMLVQSDDAARFGSVKVDATARVQQFNEKVTTRGWINSGVYILPTTLLSDIPAEQPVSLEREVFPQWAEQGDLYGYQSSGQLLDIGTPAAYAQASTFLASI